MLGACVVGFIYRDIWYVLPHFDTHQATSLIISFASAGVVLSQSVCFYFPIFSRNRGLTVPILSRSTDNDHCHCIVSETQKFEINVSGWMAFGVLVRSVG